MLFIIYNSKFHKFPNLQRKCIGIATLTSVYACVMICLLEVGESQLLLLYRSMNSQEKQNRKKHRTSCIANKARSRTAWRANDNCRQPIGMNTRIFNLAGAFAGTAILLRKGGKKNTDCSRYGLLIWQKPRRR